MVRLERVLDSFASDARRARLSTALAQSTVSTAMLVPGVLLDRRNDSDLQLLGIGFIIAGSMQLALSPLFLVPSPLEKIPARFLQGIANGEKPEALADRIEADLREAAARKSATRPYSGGAFLLFGAQLGIRSLLQRSPEEAAWSSYHLASSRPTPHSPSTSFSLAPTYGGVIGSVGIAL